MGEQRTTGSAGKVLEFLAKNRGVDVNIWELTEATGLASEQVQTCLSQLRNRNGLPITIVAKGRIYRYEAENATVAVPEAPREKRIYQEIGNTSAGVVIVEDEDGTLWRVTEL